MIYIKKLFLIRLVFIFVALTLSLGGLRVNAFSGSNFQQKLQELEVLMEQCSNNGIAVDYERVSYTTIQNFITFLTEDINNNVSADQIAYNENCLNTLYKNAKSNMLGYLTGAKQPPDPIERYNAGDINVSGGSIVDGAGRPVFSVGYGHFDRARQDIPKFQDYGVNNIQTEVGPNSVFEKYPGWTVSLAGGVDATVSIDSTVSQSGNNSLKIVNRSALYPNRYILISQTVNVKPNTVYNFGFSAKGKGVNNTWVSANGFDNRNSFNVLDRWQRYSFAYKSGFTTTSLTYTLVCENTTTELYLDDMYMQEVSGVNLLNNNGFEQNTNVGLKNLSGMIDALESAEQNNISVSLLLSPHYFPAYLYQDYPDLYMSNGGFIKYNINHPVAKAIIEEYLRTIIPAVKDYSSLTSICLSNEPTFNTANIPGFYTPWFQSYLLEKHKSIAQLNSAYASSYNSFEEIQMPTSVESTPLFYDWMNFNEDVFADWHKWMTDIIKEYAPGIPVHAKMMNYLTIADDSQSTIDNMLYGTDIEKFAQFTDISGNDTWAYINHEPTLLNTMAWYDFLRSVTKKPVYNSEDHIIIDRDQNFIPRQAAHVAWDLWQGAVHGRDMSSIWVWERTYDNTSDFYGSILHRPDCVDAVGRVSLDLNRLAPQVSALKRKKADVALLYSKASRVYSRDYAKTLDGAYRHLVNSGQKVDFVTENCIENALNYRALVIPAALNVTAATLNTIKSYVQNGGKVIMINPDSLTKNEYARDNETATVAYIKNNSNIIKGTDSLQYGAMLDALNPIGLNKLLIIDNATGAPAKQIDCQYMTYNGGMLINLSSLDFNAPKNISLYIDGRPVAKSRELIGGASLGLNFNADPYKPMLIEVKGQKSAEVKNIGIATQGAEVAVSWDCSDELYSGARVYALETDGSLRHLAYTTEKDCTILLSSLSDTKTIIVKALNQMGMESYGRAQSIIEGNIFTVDDITYQIKEGLVLCQVSFSNSSGNFAAGTFGAVIKNQKGNILSLAYVSRLMSPESSDMLRLTLRLPQEAYTIEGFVWNNEYQRIKCADTKERKIFD